MLALVLAGGAALGLARGSAPTAAQGEASPAPVSGAGPIARRVERIRRLEFDSIPGLRSIDGEDLEQKVEELTAEEEPDPESAVARKEQRALAAAEELLRLAELIPPDFELEDAGSGVEALIGGFYVPEEGAIFLVEEPLLLGSADLTEEKLAHEMVHALEDQHYGVLAEAKSGKLDPEAEIALSGLLEGTATVVQLRYAREHLGGKSLFTGSLRNLGAENLGAGLPPALVAIVRFPYTTGTLFVRELYRRGGWDLVNRAFEAPPQTTEEVLHPGKWLAGEGPARLPPRTLASPGAGWAPVGADQLGEFDAILLLALGASTPVVERAAAGWDGGAFEVWRHRDAEPECERPCRESLAAAVAFRWDEGVDAAEFTKGVAEFAERGLFAPPAGPLVWRIDEGYVAAGVAERGSGLAFAPTAELAAELARESAGGASR
jgi:hypothetical protein